MSLFVWIELLHVFCTGYMQNEYGTKLELFTLKPEESLSSTYYEQLDDFDSCIDNTTPKDLFSPWYVIGGFDQRIVK